MERERERERAEAYSAKWIKTESEGGTKTYRF